MEYYVLALLIIGGFMAIYFKKEAVPENNSEELKLRISELEQNLASKEIEAKQQQQNIEIANAKTNGFEQVKTENATLKEKLSHTQQERNDLKHENISLKKEEDNRNETLRKSVEATNTLQESLTKEKERLNDVRVKETELRMEKMKATWGEHEKDIENHLQLICRNHVIKYISQEDFPHPRNKPDNSIEIMDQMIVFDAKSPANDDLSNFPKYIKLQTESLKKYAKHDDVKKDLFLVIPSNTLQVINQFTYNIGDYNVYIITKDALEPIILSLKKIEEYEFADKLSPEERDNVCRIIGKFAHTTKRRIQIDQFFAEEFLDTLNKAGTQLPREILESVIQFENAEKLNPPMEKRKKQILTKDLKAKSAY
ncbi:MAG: hypothetical protein HN535_06665 [Flavobacteriales bacterium]|nr:hypothetical protein [Flavobacteriales bacterium]